MTTKYAELPLASIRKHPKNPRHKATADTELVDSIKASGLVQPLVVAPALDAPGKYDLIAGHRRADGCRKAKLKTAPAIIREDLDTEQAQIEAMLIENGRRLDLTPIEEAEGYHQLELLGYRPQAIATAVGRDVKTVRSRLKLLKLSPSTKKKVHAGQLRLEDAAALGEFADDPAETQRLEAAAKDGYNFKYALQSARRRREGARKAAALLAKLLDHGAVEVTLADDETLWGNRSKGVGPVELTATHSTDWGQHNGCLGVVQDDYYGEFRVAAVCTNPAGHAEQLDAEERARREEEAQRIRDREERDAAAKAAGDVRVATLLDLVGTGTMMPAALRDLVRVLLPDALITLEDPEPYQDALNIPEPDRWAAGGWQLTQSGKNAEKNKTLFAQHLEDLARYSDGTLTRALAAFLIAAAENNLAASWRRLADPAIAYLELLEEAGHPFCDIDQEIRADITGETTEAEAS